MEQNEIWDVPPFDSEWGVVLMVSEGTYLICLYNGYELETRELTSEQIDSLRKALNNNLKELDG